MRSPLLLLVLPLSLAGCPGQTPGADQFATDAVVQAPDTGSIDTDADAGPGPVADVLDDGAQGPDTTGPDVTGSEVLAPDAGVADGADVGAGGPCSGAGLGLFAKALDNGGSDTALGMVATADGGALLVGETGAGGSKSDVLVMRVSALGAPIWTQVYGEAGEERARAAVALADGFAVVGTTRSKGAGSADGWLLRLDANGKLLWDKTYGGSSVDELYGVAATADGGLVLAGSNRSLGGGLEDGWLVRTDGAGEVLWEHKYGGSNIDELHGLVALGDGRFAATGENWSDSTSGSDAWLVVVDAKGKQLLSKVYGHGDKDHARALAATPDGGFVLTGKASDKGNPKLWVVRTDGDGNLKWQDVIGGNQGEEGRAVAVWPDGGIAVAGETNSPTPDGSSAGVDAWLLRYDAWGNRLWNQRYGDAGNQWGSAVLALPDGGVLMAGRRFATGTSLDVWLVRTDPWGHAACSKAGACKHSTAADCVDASPCTVDRCDNLDGCLHEPLPAGSPCGPGLVCDGANCVGG